jgi:hypothetical protein
MIASLYSKCKKGRYLLVHCGYKKVSVKKAAQITDDSKFMDTGYVTLRLSQDGQLEKEEFEYELKMKISTGPTKMMLDLCGDKIPTVLTGFTAQREAIKQEYVRLENWQLTG